MPDEQPPSYLAMRVLKQRRDRYGLPWVIAGVAAVTGALIVLAWLVSR